MKKDIHRELLQHINRNYFLQSPETEVTLNLLRTILDPDEAYLCCRIPLATQGRISASALAEKTGDDENAVEEKLEVLAGRGVLYAYRSPREDRVYYSLWPIDPGGMLENIFADGVMDERKEALKHQYKAYWDSGYWNLVSSSSSPIFRIIPSDAAIQSTSDVLVFDQVKSIVEKAKTISTVKCFCRTLEDGKCGKPMDTCFYFDAWADYAIQYRKARPVSREQALTILEEAERAGLVHLTTNFQQGITAVCNCCPCCCHVLRGYNQLQNPNSLIRSNYAPGIDPGLCEDCGICRELCPTRAIAPAKEQPGSVLQYPERCIGCGLCASNCPVGAVSMVRTRDHVPPNDFREAIQAYKRARKP